MQLVSYMVVSTDANYHSLLIYALDVTSLGVRSAVARSFAYPAAFDRVTPTMKSTYERRFDAVSHFKLCAPTSVVYQQLLRLAVDVTWCDVALISPSVSSTHAQQSTHFTLSTGHKDTGRSR
jgi:hypothetical protein